MRSDAMWLSVSALADAQLDEPTAGEESVVPATRSDTAERLLRRFMILCENPRTSERMLNLVKGSLEHEGSGRRFYAVFNTMVLRMGGFQTNALRGELVASQLVGLAMMRYVIKVEPVCSVDREVVVEMLAPAIRAALNGD